MVSSGFLSGPVLPLGLQIHSPPLTLPQPRFSRSGSQYPPGLIRPSGPFAVQVAVMAGQTWVGPRFFIPSALLPAKYDYHRGATPRQLSGMVQHFSLLFITVHGIRASVSCHWPSATRPWGRFLQLKLHLEVQPRRLNLLLREALIHQPLTNRPESGAARPLRVLKECCYATEESNVTSDVETGDGSVECVICMQPVSAEVFHTLLI